MYDATSQVAGLHGDPCAAAAGEADADAWREEYTCTELLSGLIPATPFPLMPVSHHPMHPSLVHGRRATPRRRRAR